MTTLSKPDLIETVARSIANHFVERFGARMHDGPSGTVELFQPIRFNVENVARTAITAIPSIEGEVVAKLVRDAYEEGVEDGADWGEHPEGTDDKPKWIDSVTRVELLKARAALAKVKTDE